MPLKKILLLLFVMISEMLISQNNWTPAQQEIIDTMEGFSETTAPQGKGGDAYGTFLTETFSRWTLGSDKINRKAEWIESVKSWFDIGWRVTHRSSEYVEILVEKNTAFIRRVVTETYLGPEGDTSTSTAALTEIWKKTIDDWQLDRVDVIPLDSN